VEAKNLILIISLFFRSKFQPFSKRRRLACLLADRAHTSGHHKPFQKILWAANDQDHFVPADTPVRSRADLQQAEAGCRKTFTPPQT